MVLSGIMISCAFAQPWLVSDSPERFLMYSKSDWLIQSAEHMRSLLVPSLHNALNRPKSSVARVIGLTGWAAGADLFKVALRAPFDFG
jgi:hypothetical protein